MEIFRIQLPVFRFKIRYKYDNVLVVDIPSTNLDYLGHKIGISISL
ncbi:hypothetical protein LEP1GSC018_2791 [Leptospira kirschneri str. 2008720114]|nr:hypothetical protein LEP1GSC018_2791 [Leptospira kirschneri str. 2008720114]EMJ99562.1 hypothetical protein LEP1GSC176_0494 [Leptospira kirschneri str. MMD1493]EMK18042.1 hypothetical protein LEP1GSC042_0895 [Leptospira kirschneri serovar Bim str. PUO 1247]EMN04538.1 hypothetical protein LEP1GSC046_4151 [Leptospira kirschneri serovar Bim str. 1051]